MALIRSTSGNGGDDGFHVYADGVEVEFTNPMNAKYHDVVITGMKNKYNFTSFTINVSNEYLTYVLHNGIDNDQTGRPAVNGNKTFTQSNGLDFILLTDAEGAAISIKKINSITFS